MNFSVIAANGPYLIVEVSSIFTLMFTSLLLFPFFLFVQRQNREEDKKTSVYAIMNHFNFIVKYINLATLVISLCFKVDQSLGELVVKDNKNLESILFHLIVWSSFFIMIFVGFPLLTIPAVQYVLHFLLGLQRFLIFFFPDTEKHVNLSEKKLKVLLVVLYLISATNVVINAALGDKTLDTSSLSLQRVLNIYFCLNVLQLISVFFYIPIMISISKLTNLVSAAVHRPQKYIFYQILTHSLTRMIITPIFLNLHPDVHIRIVFLFSYEVFLTPFTIQVAYLLCNRKNVQTLFSSPIIELLKSILFPCYKRAQVQPEEVVESTKV